MKYCIINAVPGREDNVSKTKHTLKDFTEIQGIKYYDTTTDDYIDYIKNNEITISDSYQFLENAQLAIWATTISILNYIVDNDIDSLLVLEDDAVLLDDFVEVYSKCVDDLPTTFDLFSAYSLKFIYGDNQILQHNFLRDECDIGSKYIHKAYDAAAGCQAMLYSLSGAKTILKSIKNDGINTDSDIFIFERCRSKTFDSYIIRPDVPETIRHGMFKSTIDPQNKRGTIFY